MATERSIAVRLRAEVNDFVREMGRASGSLDDLVKRSGDSAGAASTTLARMVQSAKLQREEWSRVGGSMVAVGTAWTALNVAVAKTGIEYNTLQQTSRAALKTLLGGASQANAQMDKLDAFARTSPFSKAVFIQAQQQMLAFGIESKKVIPYLSGINEAVASAGGSSQQLAEVAFVMAQISAAGKITGQDLIQFGQRGINAAELIGSQMGKTGAEIRTEITAGSLAAGDALDALAAGMQQRFGGASAYVKDTMGGALDRVKAAWRDLSASFMEGAVSQQGGGWLVDMTNLLADMLRAIDKLPQPAKDAIAAVSGIGGAAALGVGGLMLLLPQLWQTVEATQKLAATFPRLAAAAGPVGLALAGATAVIAMVVSGIAGYAADVDRYADALKQAGRAGEEAVRQQAAKALADVRAGDALKDLGLAQGLATDAALGDAEARRRIASAFDTQLQKYRDLEDAALREGGITGQWQNQMQDVISTREAVMRKIDEEAAKRGKAADKVAQETALLGESTDALDLSATAQGRLAEAAGITATQTKDAADAIAKMRQAVADATASFVDLLGGWDAVIAKNREIAQSAADATSSTKDSWDDFYDGHTVRLSEYLAELEKQVAAQQAWKTNMLLISSRASDGLLQYLAELGPKGADLVAALVTATDDELSRMEAAFGARGAASGQEFADNLGATGPVLRAVATKMGAGAVAGVASEIASGKYTLQQIISKYDLQAQIDADDRRARSALNALLTRIDSSTGTVTIKASVRGGGLGISIPQARGGLVDYYAHGDVRDRHVAQIAPAGAYRVWAEPETHGEAYIPFRPDTRQRSLEIWRETGRRLGVQGFAAGGFTTPTPATVPVQQAGTTVVIEALTVTAPGVRDFQDLTRFLGSIDLAAHGA